MKSTSIVARFLYFSMKLCLSTSVTSARRIEGQRAASTNSATRRNLVFVMVPSLGMFGRIVALPANVVKRRVYPDSYGEVLPDSRSWIRKRLGRAKRIHKA